MTARNPLATALWEADRHLATLESALRDWLAAPAGDMVELETDPGPIQERVQIERFAREIEQRQRQGAPSHEVIRSSSMRPLSGVAALRHKRRLVSESASAPGIRAATSRPGGHP
jgi:hypothetical protein